MMWLGLLRLLSRQQDGLDDTDHINNPVFVPKLKLQ
jgi:hypothetical protein